jgi:hypothetical protein
MKKPTQPKLEVIKGSRHELEHEAMRILFTEFGSDRHKLFDQVFVKLKRQGKGKLSRVK